MDDPAVAQDPTLQGQAAQSPSPGSQGHKLNAWHRIGAVAIVIVLIAVAYLAAGGGGQAPRAGVPTTTAPANGSEHHGIVNSSSAAACPCLGVSQVSALLNKSPSEGANITVNESRRTNASMVELMGLSQADFSQSALESISGGWVASYSGLQPGRSGPLLEEEILYTTEPEAISGYLVLLEKGNATVYSAISGGMNCRWFNTTVNGYRSVFLVGYTENMVVLTAIPAVPAGDQIASIGTIANAVGSGLGA